MVASGPLILLNDLLRNADLQPYGLFGVTPVGLILLVAGILFFFFFGRWVLPQSESGNDKISEQKKLIDTWHLPFRICRYIIPDQSRLIGETPENSGIWDEYALHILAVSKTEHIEYAPWRHTRFKSSQELALLGDEKDIERFASDFGLQLQEKLDAFKDFRIRQAAGFVEYSFRHVPHWSVAQCGNCPLGKIMQLNPFSFLAEMNN